MNQTQELENFRDRITKLEKDKTRLDKENERLKIEKRTTKTASYIRFNNGPEERKSTITIRKEKIERKEVSSEFKN